MGSQGLRTEFTVRNALKNVFEVLLVIYEFRRNFSFGRGEIHAMYSALVLGPSHRCCMPRSLGLRGCRL